NSWLRVLLATLIPSPTENKRSIIEEVQDGNEGRGEVSHRGGIEDAVHSALLIRAGDKPKLRQHLLRPRGGVEFNGQIHNLEENHRAEKHQANQRQSGKIDHQPENNQDETHVRSKTGHGDNSVANYEGRILRR